MSPIQQRCMIEATISPLKPFRRGFARSNAGPFYPRKTIIAMFRDGMLKRRWPNGNHRRMTALTSAYREE